LEQLNHCPRAALRFASCGLLPQTYYLRQAIQAMTAAKDQRTSKKAVSKEVRKAAEDTRRGRLGEGKTGQKRKAKATGGQKKKGRGGVLEGRGPAGGGATNAKGGAGGGGGGSTFMGSVTRPFWRAPPSGFDPSKAVQGKSGEWYHSLDESIVFNDEPPGDGEPLPDDDGQGEGGSENGAGGEGGSESDDSVTEVSQKDAEATALSRGEGGKQQKTNRRRSFAGNPLTSQQPINESLGDILQLVKAKLQQDNATGSGAAAIGSGAGGVSAAAGGAMSGSYPPGKFVVPRDFASTSVCGGAGAWRSGGGSFRGGGVGGPGTRWTRFRW